MAARRVFFISGAGLAAYHRHGSKLLGPFPFEADERGRAEFARYLERFPDDVTHVVADVVEEEFREETVPHVLAWERRALLRTRAARAFPGARYLHAARLGREPDGRRDDRVRFSAITRPETLALWLAPMEERGVPLAGIHSPAMLTAAMLKAAGAVGEHVLVVSRLSGGGLRQTCFRRGKLRFSRLAALPDPAAGGHESHVLAEIERTRRYLGNLRSGASGDRLDVHVLSHGEPLEALRRELARGAGRNGGDRGGAGGRDGGDTPARCDVVDLATVARRLGLRRWGGETTADRLFVHLLATRPPRNHYATPDQTRRHAALRIGLALRAASAAIAAGGLPVRRSRRSRRGRRERACPCARPARRALRAPVPRRAGGAAPRPGRTGRAGAGSLGGERAATPPDESGGCSRASERDPRGLPAGAHRGALVAHE